MRKLVVFLLSCFLMINSYAQNFNIDSSLQVIQLQKDSSIGVQKKLRDSIYQATSKADSIAITKKYANKIKWEKLRARSIFPVINLGENSGVVPVTDLTEIPDSTLNYKILFELTANNPDSVIKEINYGLVETARVINLHVASGIPLKNIHPVLVVHAGALHAFTNNEHFQKKYRMDNPNIKAIHDLEKIGLKIIACGQAVAFIGIPKESFLPMVQMSLTAKTVITSYQMKGYILIDVN